MLYRYRAGIPWRDLPECFRDFKVIHLRHSRWSQKSVWKKFFELLSQNSDNKYAMIDATSVRAHQHSTGAKKKHSRRPSDGKKRRRLSTKIHATCEGLGKPTGLHLTSGQEHDLKGADVLMDKLYRANTLLADKSYDAYERMRKKLSNPGCQAVIPSKNNRLNPMILR